MAEKRVSRLCRLCAVRVAAPTPGEAFPQAGIEVKDVNERGCRKVWCRGDGQLQLEQNREEEKGRDARGPRLVASHRVLEGERRVLDGEPDLAESGRGEGDGEEKKSVSWMGDTEGLTRCSRSVPPWTGTQLTRKGSSSSS
ncbi:hypothetical protein VTN49DRAFT_6930 [Thermomyces lanuginosus]|uniref:uncharacterized protein n=1 Tax=Thermomyces lanuginosus TaxID=5541 RepID=UPI0037442447